VRTRLKLPQALALGLAQGPTELLPVSSSAHTNLIASLAGWPYAELDDAQRKSFELALHGATGLALAFDMRGELIEAAAQMSSRRIALIVLSLAPPAIAGLVLRGAIERRLGGQRSIAAGLAAGALAMAIADSRPGTGERSRADAGPADGLALGLAQAIALMPGVSRYGATLTAARARGFARRDARALSWHAALPVLLGASTVEGARLARGRGQAGDLGPLVAGGFGALVSTLLSARLLRRSERDEDSLLPYAIYRCVLALFLATRKPADRR
jgi:undecaprenyl-diphosphatase